jgi:hypothetical protein
LATIDMGTSPAQELPELLVNSDLDNDLEVPEEKKD